MPIVIDKSGQCGHLDIDKSLVNQGEIKITLTWNKREDAGMIARMLGRDAIDLDLGCYYELVNGKKTLIDGLQFAHGLGGPRHLRTKQGCYVQEPYIWHTGDDKGDSDSSGETIIINPEGLAQIKRIIVYAFIFDGAAHWSETKAVITIDVPGCENVIVEMGAEKSHKRFCAIAAINIAKGGNAIDVEKLVTFHDCHSDCDNAYGWGFTYKEGEK